MNSIRFLPLLALPFLAMLLPSNTTKPTGAFMSDRINLALRSTAHGLLRASGDSTSRIPAILQADEHIWRINISQSFDYEQLPNLLQNALNAQGIQQPYNVAVRRCLDALIDLGYSHTEVGKESGVTCGGRVMPEGCHYIEVTFLSDTPSLTFGDRLSGFFLFLAGGAFAFFWLRWWKPKPATNAQEKPAETDTHWLHFGQCRLDTTRQILICKSQTQPLTFREAKLLRLFASHPDQLLEREHIIQQVWADEGVLVGRSVDMFVSRLRKKLASDPSVGIAAVHGVGYRLETGRTPDVASNEPLSK